MAHLVGPLLGSPASLEDLRAGMVVFCTRPSVMQRCNDLAGDLWRHAGVLIDTEDGLMMCGFAPKQKYCLIPAEKLATYGRVGVATVLSDEQVGFLHRWVDQFDRKPTSYPQASVFVAGILSYARTMSPGAARRLLVAFCLRYSRRLSQRYRGQIAFICSTFVFAALNASMDRPLQLAMTADKVDRDSYIDEDTTDDVLLARWLATPSDLWRSIPSELRSEVAFAEAAAATNETAQDSEVCLEPACEWIPPQRTTPVAARIDVTPASAEVSRRDSLPGVMIDLARVAQTESRYAMI